jgi:bifunctional DNA-binding transcriptional regulator/antitoxin component of YhaV-PrlF toxin-antitoxin module
MAHKNEVYTIRLGDRGRLVLPAKLRRLAGLQEGEELVALYERGALRLVSRKELARSGRGMFAALAPERDLVKELLRERREEARRENARRPPARRRGKA